jgi:ribosomal protein L37AE/L43A
LINGIQKILIECFMIQNNTHLFCNKLFVYYNMNVPKKLIKRTREVIKTANGKNIQTTYYNRLTKKGISKEKDITYKTKDQPRIKFIDKQVVKRNQDGDWKSEKVTKKLFKGFKKIKSDEQYNTYKKGGVAKTKDY